MMETAVFAAGCFWGVQHYLDIEPGVIETTVGYIGGDQINPTYEQVKSHKTGHVEAVKVIFDPEKTSYEVLCKLFFEIHDPGQLDGQGPDIGPQYLSGIFFCNEEQKECAEKLIKTLRRLGHECNTFLAPFTPVIDTDTPVEEIFWRAEEYHQHYYAQKGTSPYCHFRVKKFINP
ncbi:MAG: peptide-methionine (S)-S-oxide reductase MsrA [Bacteroidales bacterium]|nr:peptide-methionine (S)-S-oxide reductase MsrA [Bacteroidales bacterium]